MSKSADHCVPGGNGFRCLHCGREQPMAFPVSMSIYTAAAKAFTKDHRRCKPSEAGAARFRYSTPSEWLSSWDTGVSSLTIYAVFTGQPVLNGGPGIPHDPDDFGRCYRLLKVAPPRWRASLASVADRYPEWRPLVDRWDDLERLYEEELPTGQATKLYALMQELRATGGAA